MIIPKLFHPQPAAYRPRRVSPQLAMTDAERRRGKLLLWLVAALFAMFVLWA